MSHVMHRAGWACAAALALALIAALSRSIFAGPLDPPAPPGATQPQVEPRSPIPPVGWSGTFPIVISQPGSYFLTRSLTDTTTGVSAIQIAANDVALDLNGFSLTGGGYNGQAYGVQVTGVRSNLTSATGTSANGMSRSTQRMMRPTTRRRAGSRTYRPPIAPLASLPVAPRR